jgi:hypothetical protein
MSSGDEYNTYEEYIAALEHDSKILDEMYNELEAISLAEQDIQGVLNAVERELDKGTEEGLAAGLEKLGALFEGIELDEGLVK